MRDRARQRRPILLMVRPASVTAPRAWRPADDTPSAERCPACGSPLEPDQEWCLECGAARTTLQKPPDWRIAVAIILAMVLVVVIVLVIALP